MTRHVVTGLRHESLGGYLASLGLFRVLAEQADPAATAAWTDDGLAVESTVDDLPEWLVEAYAPTPVLSPWNEGSGFGAKDKTPREKLTALLADPAPRFDRFREAMTAAAKVAEAHRANGWSKEKAVQEFRNRCPDALVPWIDASVVLTENKAYFPPLLGTGGNDGRLDFSTNFHQRLMELLGTASKTRARALAYARDLISGTQTERLVTAPIGQFDPAAAGGPNSSPFGAGDSIVNPWAYVLLIEGALLFASTIARRSRHQVGRAAMPFTVIGSPEGSPSGAVNENSRGEIWAPLWRQPYAFPEVRQLFGEARASWRGRPAQRAVEFYAATRTLGVARGVESFLRYGLHRRNGLAFVAVPIERVDVTENPEVRLVAKLEDWVSGVRRAENSSAVAGALRRFDSAQLAYVRGGTPIALGRLLAALTGLQMAVGRSGRLKETLRVPDAPRADDFLAVLKEVQCPELRIAVGIASCAVLPNPRRPQKAVPTMRHLLLPIDPERRWRDAPVVAGFGLRPLQEVLADVLVWRSRTAPDERDGGEFRGVPTFRRGIPVPASDLHAFADGRLDEARLDLWLRACLALGWPNDRHRWAAGADAPLVAVLGLLHPFAEGLADRSAAGQAPKLGLNPDWAVRLAAGRSRAVHEDAVRRLRQAGWLGVPAPQLPTVDGRAVAAALVPRCHAPRAFLEKHFAIALKTEEPSTEDEES